MGGEQGGDSSIIFYLPFQTAKWKVLFSLLTDMGATEWEELKDHKFRSDMLRFMISVGYQAEVCHRPLSIQVWY